MPVRSDRLSGPDIVPANGFVTLFVVPAGETWLVKRLTTQNSGLITNVYGWGVRLGGIEGQVHTPSVAPSRADDHETWLALDPGAELRVNGNGSAGVVYAFGAKLLGTA